MFTFCLGFTAVMTVYAGPMNVWLAISYWRDGDTRGALVSCGFVAAWLLSAAYVLVSLAQGHGF